MCLHQSIPPVDYIERIRTMLAAAEETSDEGRDIFALDEHNLGTNDQVVEDLNYITTTLDVANLQENLLNRGRIRIPYTLPSDYEDIFKLPGFSRRDVRPVSTKDPTDMSIEEVFLIEDWVRMCLDDSSTDFEAVLPGDMTAFESLMKHGMPTRLSLDSWIAKTLLDMVSENLSQNAAGDCFTMWQPEIGSDYVHFGRNRDGKLVTAVNLVGLGEPGRLVWAPRFKHGRPIRLSHGCLQEIGNIIHSAETAIVALARRIATYIARSIVYQYAAPKADERGYDILTTKQIVDAVREILGEEWFDLPFDDNGKLLNWSEEDVWVAAEEMDD